MLIIISYFLSSYEFICVYLNIWKYGSVMTLIWLLYQDFMRHVHVIIIFQFLYFLKLLKMFCDHIHFEP